MVTKQKINVDDDIKDIVDRITKLSSLDLSKLKKALEEMWDVKASAAAPMMMAMPSSGQGEAARQEEATDFRVMLEEVPADKKISVIKAVREITGLGLKEARELVVAELPKAVKDSAPKAEAEEVKKKLVDAGAKVSLTSI